MGTLHWEVVCVHDWAEPAISINISSRSVPGTRRIAQVGAVGSFPVTQNGEVVCSRCDGRC